MTTLLFHKKYLIAAAILMSACMSSNPCRAVDLSEIVPASEKGTVIVSTLTAIVIVGDPAQVRKEGLANAAGLQIKEVPFLEQTYFRKLLEAHVGLPLTRGGRAQIVSEVVAYYRDHGRPLVNVSTPPQDITYGVLQILVLEGKVGKIRVEGRRRWFDFDALKKQVRANQGGPLDAGRLSEDLDWINRNPFRHVDVVYVKGAELGETDLVLREVEQFPLRAYFGYDDSGTNLTENDRLMTGVNWGNVLGFDGVLGYQFMTSPDFTSFRAHSGSFTQPLPWRHFITVFGSYADTRANLPQPFNLAGYNWQTSLRYEAPLPRLGNFRHSVVAGFDVKRSNNNLTFGGTSVFSAIADVDQWSFGYDSSLRDRLGQTSLRGTVFFSPGGMTSQDNNSAYLTSRAASKAHYTYGKLELNRTTGLPWDFMLVNLITVQVSEANLLPSEQIGFGGYDTIRGYDTRVFNSDAGYIISTELRTPSLPGLSYWKKFAFLKDRFQWLGFVDYGAGSNHLRLPGEQTETKLWSAGPGFRYNASTHLTFRADYGWQLINPSQTPRPYPSRAHIGIVVSY